MKPRNSSHILAFCWDETAVNIVAWPPNLLVRCCDLTEQDSRWGDAEKKLLRRTKFSKVLEQKVRCAHSLRRARLGSLSLYLLIRDDEIVRPTYLAGRNSKVKTKTRYKTRYRRLDSAFGEQMTGVELKTPGCPSLWLTHLKSS